MSKLRLAFECASSNKYGAGGCMVKNGKVCHTHQVHAVGVALG